MSYQIKPFNGKVITTLYDFLLRNQYVFILPKYQRKYDWTKKEVDDLMKDISNKLDKNNDESLWLGVSLIYHRLQSNDEIEIVDGQQRYLTFLMIWKIFNEKVIKDFIINTEPKWDYFQQHDESVTYLDIINFIKSEHGYSKKKNLNKIIEIINNHKKINLNKVDDWIKFIKEKLLITLISVPDNYGFFENINSKQKPLTLTEKCFSFLTVHQQNKIILKNKNIIQKWLTYKDNDNLTKSFIKIYWQKYSPDKDFGFYKDFDQFKYISCKDFKIFIDFLCIYFQQLELTTSEIDNFFYYYLYRILWKIYWPIIIAIKIRNKNDILEHFLVKELWKADLYIHLLGKGKKINKKIIFANATKIIKCEDNLKELLGCFAKFLQKLIKLANSSYSFSKKSFFVSGDFYEFALDENNKKRMKLFFWLMFVDTSDQNFKIILENKSLINNFDKRKDWELEHIIPIAEEKPMYTDKKNNLFLIYY